MDGGGNWWKFPVKRAELCNDARAGESPTQQGLQAVPPGQSLPGGWTGPHPEGWEGVGSVSWLPNRAFLLETQSFLSISHRWDLDSTRFCLPLKLLPP